MRRLTGLAFVAVAAVATAGLATPSAWAAGAAEIATVPTRAPPPSERPAAKGGHEARVFISPSGEPFRQGPADPDPLKAWFDQVDAAHKGYLDRADFRADATRFFQRLDANGDKVIDGFEVADYEAEIAPELVQWASGEFPGEFATARGQQGRRGGEGGQAPGAPRRDRNGQRGVYQLINEPEPVSNADFDFDGHVGFDEWMRATDQRFTILDANKDGRVTLEELRARFLPIKK